jgi:protein-tyrosine phosphatase
MLDATRLYPKLWIGSAPPTGPALADAGFGVLVLCAEEYQPRLHEFPGLVCVTHAGFDDDVPDNETLDTAVSAAMDVVDHLQSGERVLVTCMAGRNRSGLVCALALHLLTGYDTRDCVLHIKKTRVGNDGGEALTNPHFVNFLKTFKIAC